MSFIDEMIEDIASKKKTVDNIAFLNFLKEELDRKGIILTVNCQKPTFVNDNIITSEIVGVELDLSEHDKKKDAEIEKYKEAFESAKCERDKEVCEYRNKIDKLTAENAELHCQIQAINMYPDESIREPIKMADWIVHHFKQGLYPGYERDDNGNIKCVELGGEKIPLQTGEYENYTEVREIADYLLAYCKYHSEG